MSSSIQSENWRSHPAKVQVKESDLPSSIPPQTGLTFNVWYNKWSQGKSGNSRFVSPYKLEPEPHSGYTKGDKNGNVYFCLYFSKGMCCLGKKCEYLHHVPDEEDVVKLALKSDVLDCFGREKFADYRDDMSGVGSFRKKNKTLYVGGIMGGLNNKQLKPSQIESRIRFTFGKFGSIDRVRFVESKNCGFVTFKHSVNAEFAKEAMSNQTLLIPSDKEWDQKREGTGVLVKWANDDPNPETKKREAEEQKNQSIKVMVELLNRYEKGTDPKRGLEVDTAQEREEGDMPQAMNLGHSQEPKSLIFSDKSLSLLGKLKKRKLEISKPLYSVPASTRSLVDYSSSDDD